MSLSDTVKFGNKESLEQLNTAISLVKQLNGLTIPSAESVINYMREILRLGSKFNTEEESLNSLRKQLESHSHTLDEPDQLRLSR